MIETAVTDAAVTDAAATDASATGAAPTEAAAEGSISSRRAQTRERLMHAAVSVFAERGVNGASVEEICEAAGFTRGAFYSNFGDKSSLVLAMIQRNVDADFAAAQHAIATMKQIPDQSPIELVGTALSVFEAAGRTPAEGVLAEQELLLHAARDPELRRPYREFMEACSHRIAALVVDGLQHLGLRFTIPLDHASELLSAIHSHERLVAIFKERQPDGAAMRSLLLAITTPA